MRTLIALQDEAIAKLHQPRTSERRHARYRCVVYRWYAAELDKLMPKSRQYLAASWTDVLDMWKLQRDAEDA